MSPRLAAPSTRRVGAVLVVLLVPLALAGYVLALGYDSAPARAHDAVAAMTDGALGWVRGVHAWSATAVLVAALLHVARAYASGGAAILARGRWLTGAAILGVLFGATLGGSILAWDQQGWEAWQHVGQAGAPVSDVPDETPLRLVFLGHIFAVPALIGALLLAHWRRRDATTRLVRRLRDLVFARSTLATAALALLATATLAAMAPPALGPAPIPGLEITRPDWPFLWLVPLQDAMGPLALWALPVGLATLAALPWLTRSANAKARAALVWGTAALLTLLTVLGAR